MKINFKKIVFFSSTVFLLASVSGCISNRNISGGKTETEKNIPTGQCRIEAQVIRIDSTLSVVAGDPCSKAPCIAWIKIKYIIGYGAGSSTLNRGDTLKAKFAFTLAPAAKENFPGLKENLPGLTEGSTFTANIQLQPANPFSKDKENVFLIYGYKKTD